MLIDSHCHLTDERFRDDRSAVLDRAWAAGVTGVVTIASDLADSRAVAELVTAHHVGGGGPRLWGTAGIHPHEAAAATEGDLREVGHLARATPGVVAVGETGLDFHYDHSPRSVQLGRFEAQIELARELELPVVVHSRSADEDTIAVLRSLPPDVRGVLHCFTGGAALLEAGLDADWYVSFSGIVSFRSYDDGELVRQVPADRLLVETDAPYLAPIPHRGKRNEPAHVTHVVEAVARIRGEDPETLRDSTSRNAFRFYGIDRPTDG